MTQQEERDLLIKDLCGRLPYDIVINDEYGDYINVNIHNAHIEHLIDRVVSGLEKMVLRPMSSMTDEEYNEWFNYYNSAEKTFLENSNYEDYFRASIVGEVSKYDWLNKNMFDFRGLIPKGLALEAKEGMYIN